MDAWESDSLAAQRPPRTLVVLAMLVAAAGLFSWLGAYALMDALTVAGLVPPWMPDHDPRPQWMVTGFVSLLAVFLVVGGLVQWMSRRQLRGIDAQEDED